MILLLTTRLTHSDFIISLSAVGTSDVTLCMFVWKGLSSRWPVFWKTTETKDHLKRTDLRPFRRNGINKQFLQHKVFGPNQWLCELLCQVHRFHLPSSWELDSRAHPLSPRSTRRGRSSTSNSRIRSSPHPRPAAIPLSSLGRPTLVPPPQNCSAPLHACPSGCKNPPCQPSSAPQPR